MRTARQVAVRAIAAQPPTTVGTGGAIAVHAATGGAATSTGAATTCSSAAVEGATAGPVHWQAMIQIAVHPAPMQTPAGRAPTTKQRAIGNQIAAFAAVHDAYGQHWSTLTKTKLRAEDWGKANNNS